MQNKKCFQEIQVICLDFDSTIINHEGIDELARQKECYSEVAEITRQAMEEGLSYKESLEKRLNTYNRTGKFPTKITGSKILKFGSIVVDIT